MLEKAKEVTAYTANGRTLSTPGLPMTWSSSLTPTRDMPG